MQKPAGTKELAEEACYIELDVLRKPIGKQDQYMAAFGGLTALNIDREGDVKVDRLGLSAELVQELESNSLLFFTDDTPDATSPPQPPHPATNPKHLTSLSILHPLKNIDL